MAIHYKKPYENITIDGAYNWPNYFTAEQKRKLTEAYEVKVTKQLNKIASVSTGIAVLKEISRSLSAIRIIPRLDPSGNDVLNASEYPTDRTLATQRGMPVLCTTPGPAGMGGGLPGLGSDAVVEYWAAIWETGSSQSGPGTRPDEVLLHELVHAVRDMWGVSHVCSKVGGGYDNVEEFYAILVSNMYMSEQHQATLRANHGAYSPMKKEDEKNFLKTYHSLIEAFTEDQPFLASQLNLVKCRFNPIREYEEEWKDQEAQPGSIASTPR